MTYSTKVVFFLFVFAFFSTVLAQEVWDRQAEIPVPDAGLNTGGIGNMVTNVDLDNDGLVDLYVINHNWNDATSEMTARAYKLEDAGSGWEIVWQAEFDVWQQNTWPAIAVDDLDGDGKGELIFGPVNWVDAANNPNPPRVLVYESVGDGSDDMGVSDGFGGWLPNTKNSITDQDNVNLRPFRFVVKDVDSDGTKELIFADRTATSSQWSFGVLSVSDVPDNGDGSETWTVEANGLTAGLDVVENKWDVAVMDSVIYLFDEVECSRIVYNKDTDTYTAKSGQPSVLAGAGSWKSSQVLDIDGNAQEEIVVGNWFATENTGIWVYEYDATGDSLVGTMVVDLSQYSTSYGVYGSAYGDIDNNGKMDFVFGTRSSTPSNAMIFRAEYIGSQDNVRDPASWRLSVIDSAYTDGGRWGILQIANVDDDANKEVLYTSSVPDGKDELVPIIVLNLPSQVTPGPWSKVDPPSSTANGVFAGDTLGQVHAVAVDGQDKVWVSGWSSGHLTVYNAAGEVQFTVDSLVVPKSTGGDTTLYTTASRGMATDNDGNIIYAQSGYIAKISPDGTGLAWTPFAGSPGAPVVDDEGFIYVGFVVGVTPVSVIDPATFTVTQTVDLDPLPGTFMRGMFVSADGTTIIPGNLDAGIHSVYQFESSDFINYPLADSIRYNDKGEPILVTQTVTMDRTPDGAMWLSQDNSYAAAGPDQNVNAMIRFDFDNMTYSETPLPESGATKFDGPRGAAWNSDGTKMYVAAWNRGVVWEYTGNFFVTGLEKSEEIVPVSYKLDQNYPNPFNPTTEINFTITQANRTSLKIFNVLGQEVATLVNKNLPAGAYKFNFDASKLASGTYIYKLESGDFVDSRKMTLIK
ncbi:MAG: T9SS type A sorting domain-containing protein [Calditrichaeota bacterium]|nr:T9SS type A sorting domain-containing protein [Calditrichota bacterium]